MKKIFSLIVIALFVFTLAACNNEVEETGGQALLRVDINPSIEYVLDENNNVISFTFNNDDAEIAAGDIDFEGMSYDEAMEAFIDAAYKAGFIDVETNDNTIVVTVGNIDETEESTMQENAQQVAQGFAEEHKLGIAVLSGKDVYDDLSTLAEEYNISLGKARMVESAEKVDMNYSYQELADMEMSELLDIIVQEHRNRVSEFVASRKANAKTVRDEMIANNQAKINQHEQAVDNGTATDPDFDQIRNNAQENFADKATVYRQRANRMRNNAVGNQTNNPYNKTVLRVGMDLRYPPFETVDENNDPEGISVDVAMAFGEFLGREVEIVNTDFGSLIPALNAGQIDIAIASMSITAEREKSVDFSQSYFYFKIISLLNKNYAEDNGLDEDSTTDDILAVENTDFVGITNQVSASIPESYGKEVTEATDLGTAIENVAQGNSDVLLMSANPVVNGYKANPNRTIVVWDAFVSSPIGMAVAEGNQELLQQANAFIETFDNEDGLYETLATDWDDILLERLGRYGLEFYINE